MKEIYKAALLAVREGRVLLCRKRGTPTWILPGGKIEAGEAPEEALRREIGEESSFSVLSIELLSEFFLSPGASSERLYLFFATIEAPPASQARPVFGSEDEYIFGHAMTPEQFLAAVERGEARDAKMICGAEWLRRNLHRLES